MVLGVSGGDIFGGDDVERVNAFIDQTQVTFDVGFDLTQSYDAYRRGPGVAPFPLEVVLDRAGNVQYISREYDAAALDDVITSLLAEDAP